MAVKLLLEKCYISKMIVVLIFLYDLLSIYLNVERIGKFLFVYLSALQFLIV